MVFQHFNLFHHLNVLKNVALGPRKILRLSQEEAVKVATESLEKVGMIKWNHHYPAELSGGQQQRVAIARALAMKPKMVLFDEPTSALDPELIGEVLDVMQKLSLEGLTNITVTHEMGFARAVANKILFLCDGVILEEGPPQELLVHPKQDRTKRFIRKITELYGSME
jgi:polar amino acid transport system ATP-binding protein